MCDIHDQEDAASVPVDVPAFIDELVVALTNARIYAAGHPRVNSTLDSLYGMLQALTDEHAAPALVIGTADGYLFHDRKPLLGVSLSANRIIKALEQMASGGLYFEHSATRDDLLTLVEVLGQGHRGPTSHVEANQALTQGGCTKIRVLAEYGDGSGADGLNLQATDTADGGPSGAAPGGPVGGSGANGNGPGGNGTGGGGGTNGNGERLIPTLVPTTAYGRVTQDYQRVVDGMQNIMVEATRGGMVRIDTAQDLVETVLQELADDPKSLMGLARYERYDAFTFGHSIRVCSLATLFASTLLDDEHLVRRVGTAALMHDVGKARVPFEILYAKGRLTPEERTEMNRHTEYGGDILLDAPSSDPASVAAAFGHHIRLTQLREENRLISMLTRLVKICDVFEALTAVRPYKDPMHPVRAYRIMLTMEGHFDLALLRRFIEINGIYPVGYTVELTDGRWGVVHKQTEDLCRPIVDIDSSPTQEMSERLDLSKLTGKDAVQVVDVADGPKLGAG